MFDNWKSILAAFASLWQATRERFQSELLWKVVILLTIFSLAGPEVIAAIELQVLLELMGATLFMTAFAAGAKLLLLDLAAQARRILLLALRLFSVRNDAARIQMGVAAMSILAYGEWWLATASAGIASIQYTVKWIL